MIKKYLTLLSSAAIATSASAQLLVSDGFDTGGTSDFYGTDAQLDGLNPTSAGSGWGGAWSSDSDNRIQTDNFSVALYSDGTETITRVNPAGSGGTIRIQGNSGFEDINRSFSSAYTGDLFYSFLVANGDADTDTFRFTVGDVTLRDNGSGISIGDTDGAGDATALGGTTWAGANFIVVGVTGAGSANSTLNLWINPTDLTDIANQSVAATVSYTGGEIGAFDSLRLASGGDGAGLQFDEFRLGRTLQDVTGITQVPEPGAYALISGFLALGWIMIRRRS